MTWVGEVARPGCAGGRKYHSPRHEPSALPDRHPHFDKLRTGLLVPPRHLRTTGRHRAGPCEEARCHRCRRRGLRGLRPVGLGAQGRTRERRAQPRQVARRHGLHRPAPRQCQHLRFLRSRHRADRAGGLRHRALHRRRPGGGAARRRRHRAGRRAARTWTCSIPGPSTARRRRSSRCACEAAAFATDKRITNSEGAGVSAQQSHFFSAHTRGFRGGYASSRHSISVAPIAGKGDGMQRDAWYTSMRSRQRAVRRPRPWAAMPPSARCRG